LVDADIKAITYNTISTPNGATELETYGYLKLI